MLLDPDQRRIDEDVFEIRILGQVLENPLPHVLLRPPPEARVDGVPFAKLVRQISEPPTTPPPQTEDHIDIINLASFSVATRKPVLAIKPHHRTLSSKIGPDTH
jgi:hypothetical protein